jgi:DNA-binding NarL/FixJ family response regulator
VRSSPWILVVDDDPASLEVAGARLAAHEYTILTATNGEQALKIAREQRPDLVLLDIVMPGMGGLEVCLRLKADQSLPFMPIILLTAKADPEDIVAGLEAGGDEYLTKPVEASALVARVKSMLRIKALYDTVQEQAQRLEAQTGQLAEWNRSLEQRVADQVAEIERVSRLKRFLSPQIAELIISSGDDALLGSHRQEITVLFCHLRGFAALSETGEPEEVMGILGQFNAAMGELVLRFEATMGRFGGDGLMVFFNDPLPCPDPAARAVRMAVAMRERALSMAKEWRKRGHDLSFGAGIAMGYATLGKIGAGDQFHYGTIGIVTSMASRLCEEAEAGQILIGQRVYAAVEDIVEAEPFGELQLRGFLKPVGAYRVHRVKESAAPDRPSSLLSKRETEVAGLVAAGFSNRHIAETLYVSERTVESHVQSILNKLGYHARTQIAAWAVTQGLSTDRGRDEKTSPRR